MKPYEPCVEDATAHIHVDWKTHESTGKFAPYPKMLCSMCPPSTEAESEEEYRKYVAYEKRVIRENATRRPSKPFWRRLKRLIYWILR